MIKFLGSKKKLLETIYKAAIKDFDGEVESVIDLFSGTSRVGHHFKSKGHRVIANDYSNFAKVLAECYVVADRDQYLLDAQKLIDEYNSNNNSTDGWFTDEYCFRSRFFQPKNGKRVDWIREDLERKSLDPVLKSIMLTSLMKAADAVDSTCGVQMAYLKQWATRSDKDLILKIPPLLPASLFGSCEAHKELSEEASMSLKADVVYLDPPYNQHSYLGNYHIWESLVLWDKPETYGVAHKRIDTRDNKSDFNGKNKALPAMTTIIENVSKNTRRSVVSYSNEGYISYRDMLTLLASHGKTVVYEVDFKRYIGAVIGVYNDKGVKVGTPTHTKNKEYIFVTDF